MLASPEKSRNVHCSLCGINRLNTAWSASHPLTTKTPVEKPFLQPHPPLHSSFCFHITLYHHLLLFSPLGRVLSEHNFAHTVHSPSHRCGLHLDRKISCKVNYVWFLWNMLTQVSQFKKTLYSQQELTQCRYSQDFCSLQEKNLKEKEAHKKPTPMCSHL